MPDIIAASTDGLADHDQNDIGVNDGWINCRNSATGSDAKNATVFSTAGVYVKKWATDRFQIRRSFFAFDTSAIECPDDGAATATLKIYGRTTGTANIIVVKATKPDLSTGIVQNDFNELTGWNSSFGPSDLTAYSSQVTSWNTSAYNEITLNRSARDDMASLSIFKLALMEYDHDYLGVEYNPGAFGEVAVGLFYNHPSSLANGKRPTLTYTSGPCGYAHTIIGVPSSNIGEINGLETSLAAEVIGKTNS